MKKIFILWLFIGFLTHSSLAQPCFDWSVKTVSNSKLAYTSLKLLDDNNILEVTVDNHSYTLPPNKRWKCYSISNGNLTNPVTIFSSSASFTGYVPHNADKDFNNSIYLSGEGQITFNGTTYNGKTIKRMNSSGAVIDVFPVQGYFLNIDFNNNLYCLNNNTILRYNASGILLDSILFSGNYISMSENSVFTISSGDTLQRYLYPGNLIQTLIIPDYKNSFTYNYGNTRYYLSYKSQNPDSITVIDSLGTAIFKTVKKVDHGYLVNSFGELYSVKDVMISKYDSSGVVWTTELKFNMDGASNSYVSGLFSSTGDLYFCGSGFYDSSGITGPNSSLAYYIKPGLYKEISTEGSGYEYFGFMGKIKADGSVCNTGISTPTISLCSGVTGTFTASSSELFGSQSFGLELSDSTGSFTNPVSLGGSTYPVVNYYVPNNLPAGNYMIRAKLSNPLVYGTPKPVTISNIDFSGNRELTNMIHDSVLNKTFACIPSSFTVHANTQGMQYRLLAKAIYSNFQTPITSYSSDSIYNFISAGNLNKQILVQLKNSATGCESKWPLINYVSADTMKVSISASFFPGDTIVNCKNSPPVKLSYYPQLAFNEMVNGLYISGNGIYINNSTNTFYFYPDSVTPGYHTIFYDLTGSGLQCGNIRDSLTFFVDTCLNTIVTGVVAPSGELCANQLANIPFTALGTYDSTNIFKVIYNNTVIGEGTASPITIVVPGNGSTTSRFRVIATSPPDTGTYNYDGEFNISWFNTPEIITSQFQGNCFRQGDLLTAGSQYGYTNKWFVNDSLFTETTYNIPITASIPGNYHVEISNGICSGKSNSKLVIDSASFNFSLELEYDTGFVCQGDTMRAIAHTWTGSTFKWYFDSNLLSNETDSVLLVTHRPQSGAIFCEITSPLGYIIRKYAQLPYTFPKYNITLNELTSDTIIRCYPSLPVNLSISGSINGTYQWYKNGLLSPGDTLRSISVTSEGYFVLETTENGCSAISPVIQVKNVAPAVIQLTPNYLTYTCDEDSVQLFAIGGGIVDYKWYLNSFQIENAFSDNYYAKEAGAYHIYVSDSNGCIAAGGYARVLNEPCPLPIFIGSIPSYACPNDSIILQVASNPDDKFIWYINGIADSSSTSNTFVVSQPGYYYVEVESKFGCIGYSDTITINQGSLPVAVATALGSTTFCQGDSVSLRAQFYPGCTYQWYNGHYSIPGAVSQIYKAKTAGNYRVEVTNSQGCTAKSVPITIVVPCIFQGDAGEKNEVNSGEPLKLNCYPMPFDNYLQISIVSELSDNLIAHLYTSSGKLIRSFEIPVISGENTHTLNTKDLPSGMYLIKLSGNYVNESMKVVKQ